MRKKGRAVILVVSLIAGALLLLPSLLGSRPVLHALLSLASRHLAGTLEMEDCSLGWLQGLRCEQVRYDDSLRGLRFEVPRLTSDKGLLLLLAAPSYLGEIILDHPTLSFLPHQSGHKPPRTQANDSVGAESKPGASNQEGHAPASWWERLTFRLHVNSGGLVLIEGPPPGRKLAEEIKLTGSLAMGTVNYDVYLRSALQAGYLRAKGFVNLPTAGQSLLETLISRSEVEIKDLELTDFLDLAASRSSTPRGKGVLNAAFHLNASGLEDLEAQGEIFLRGLQLTGGVLGVEHPMLDQLNFIFKGSHRTGEGWRLSALDLQSEPIRLTGGGSFDGKTVSLAAKGSVNLPAIAAQVPRLLGLHEKTTITEGTADFSLGVTGVPEALAIRAECRTDRLNIVHDSRKYSWDTPLDLLAEADYSQEKTAFRTLRVHMPFFEAQGSGGIDDFALQAGGDLDQMFQELGKIFTLTVHAKGRTELSASTRRREDGGFSLESRVSIHGFALSRGKAALFPAHDFLLSGKVGTAPSFVQDGALQSVQIDGNFWPGKITLMAEDLQRSAGQAPNNCTLKGAADLERLNALVQAFTDASPFSVLKGKLEVDGAGRCEGRQVSLQSLNGTVEQLVVAGPGSAVQEPRVVFAMGEVERRNSRRPVAVRELLVAENWQDLSEQGQPVFLVDFDRQRLEVRHLGWASANTNVDTNFVVEDWWQPAANFSAALKGETDGALFTDIARSAGWFPADLSVKGRAWADLATVSGERQGNRTDLTLRMEPFEIWRGKEKIFTDSRPILKLSLHNEEKIGGAVSIPAFFLHTAPMRIEGAGLVARNNPPSLELQGQMTPDFIVLAPLLAPIFGRDAIVTGNRPGDFLLSLPLAFPLRKEQLTFSAQVPVDSLRFQGAGLRQLTLPVDLNRGKLRVTIEEKLDGGRVSLQPLWDLTTPQVVLTLPPATQLFKDVPLKSPLVHSLLGRMHPLFGALAQSQGTVDLRLESFSVPMAGKGSARPVYTATVALARIKFKATDVLREILNLGGFDQEWMRCREHELICEGKSGLVSCTPVHLMAGAAEFGLRGHLNMDDSLHYQVRMPVGKQLADKAQLIVQAEATVEAEIGGARAKPIFDQATFLAGLSGQLRKGIELEQPKAAGETEQPPTSGKPAAAESQPKE
ncbi:hypothetical protein [uncultured Desulfobulbus sp.]|uniref:hypothetical protein n=1 Tax=uncultured Desulfobulbus sp. TaxID=239745 RepID=UPI0029C8FFE1|nr:hypothetical protein [uncultured Desulfobulbus sp.]